MIFNFVQLLKDQFPDELFYTNGRVLLAGQEEIPDRNVNVNDTGGPVQPWTRYGQFTVQVITRDKTALDSRKLAMDIFNFLEGRFGLLLPSVIVDGDTYPSFKVGQISAVQLPYNLGSDDEGRNEYSTNYQLVGEVI